MVDEKQFNVKKSIEAVSEEGHLLDASSQGHLLLLNSQVIIASKTLHTFFEIEAQNIDDVLKQVESS